MDKQTEDIKLFGYFSDTTDIPEYDPELNCVCIFCRKKLEEPVVTTNFYVPGDDKSYFYRVHKDCFHEMEREGTSSYYEGLIIDTIPIQK